jgi:hypothetical protein
MMIKLLTNIASSALDFQKMKRGIRNSKWFLEDWNTYSKLPNAELLSEADAYPCLYDKSSYTHFDSHYFYQSIWAFNQIKQIAPGWHVDVGSLILFVGLLSTITRVTFMDIRPAQINLDNFHSEYGSILNMPYADKSVFSLSCLHVAEHIGLGRYGEPLDPNGTKKATIELSRILAIGGHLYFSLPVGLPRVQFNAHRIHSPNQILAYFSSLELASFSAVTDQGEFKENIMPSEMESARYSCGMFHFTKR